MGDRNEPEHVLSSDRAFFTAGDWKAPKGKKNPNCGPKEKKGGPEEIFTRCVRKKALSVEPEWKKN